MKLSLLWVFDHLASSLKDISIDVLVDTFNKKTAEIESVKKVEIDPALFCAAKVTSVELDFCKVYSDELRKEFKLSPRKDASVGAVFLLKKGGADYAWATLSDWGAEKEGLFGQVCIPEDELKGSWKHALETEDYIVTLENKSITHRPDMWCHRGFAREVAALFELELLPEEQYITTEPIKQYEICSVATPSNPFVLEIKDTVACSRLAGLALRSVQVLPSLVPMATRLARVDSKPINSIVDCTNYVMYDFGQPLHAFAADKVASQTFIAERAGKKQSLALLDDTVIELCPDDLIISDGTQPLALAGVMGGKESSVSFATQAVYIESAHFSPSVIRNQALRHKKRTEASARFEKNLDPNQNTQALLRYSALLDKYRIPHVKADAICSIGKLAKELTIEVSHSFICQRLGVVLNPDAVEKSLYSLGFGVTSVQKEKEILYTVTVPTFRATKDVQLQEDIVEEVGRLFGYEKIPSQLPTRKMQPACLNRVMMTRAIKRQLAYGLALREVQNYAFYDEDFLAKIGHEPQGCVELKNPVSERDKKLVQSLIPHLLKNISVNVPQHSSIRFFECNRIWKSSFSLSAVNEQLSTAGIIFSRTGKVSFYESKALLEKFFKSLGLLVTWKKIETEQAHTFYSIYETAELWVGDEKIGLAGKIDTQMLARITEGDAFIFELATEFLFTYRPEKKKAVPLSKYQDTYLDISMLIKRSVSVDTIQKALAKADSRIQRVVLIDFYEKDEWHDSRSVTMRCTLLDAHKTLVKDDIDKVMQQMIAASISLGATVR